MKYNINLLGEKYAEYLSSVDKTIVSPKTNWDISAYNDLEYLDVTKSIQKEFENVEDIAMYEKFLKGE